MEYDFADRVSHRAGHRRRRADSGLANRRRRHLQRRSSRQNAGLHFQHFRQRRHHRADDRRADRDSRELESDFLDQHSARHHRRFTVDHRAQGRSEEAASPYRLHRRGADGVGDRDHHDRVDPRRYIQHRCAGRSVLHIRDAARCADLLREPDIRTDDPGAIVSQPPGRRRQLGRRRQWRDLDGGHRIPAGVHAGPDGIEHVDLGRGAWSNVGA